MVKDPVCGMRIDPETAEFTSHYKDHEYYFCNKACKTEFDAHPGSYVKRKRVFARFLDWIAKSNKKTFHGDPPHCCGQ
jgi:YHS domain-containing protein